MHERKRKYNEKEKGQKIKICMKEKRDRIGKNESV